MIVKVHS